MRLLHTHTPAKTNTSLETHEPGNTPGNVNDVLLLKTLEMFALKKLGKRGCQSVAKV